jgi:hypothetical protein
MTELQHQKKISKPKVLVVHGGMQAGTLVEPYRPAFLSEYVAAGFSACRNRAGDEIHLIHRYALYGANA